MSENCNFFLYRIVRSREFGLLTKWHLNADLEQREKRRKDEIKIENMKKVFNFK